MASLARTRPVWFCALAFLLVACSQTPREAAQRYVDRGDEYAEQGLYREAIIEYLNAVQRDLNYAFARERLGDAYLAVNEGLSARDQFLRAADLLPDDSDLQVKAGGVLLLMRDFGQARALADRVLQRDPTHVKALVLKANALAGLEALDSALRLMRDVIELQPGQSELYTNLGGLELTGNQPAEAEAAFKRAIELAPQSSGAHAALGNFYWATGRLEEAERAFLQAVAQQPPDLVAYRAIATFYISERRPGPAERYVKAVAELSGELDDELMVADFYVLTGRKAEGLALLDNLATRPAGYGKARPRTAGLAYSEGRRQEAHQILDEVLAREPRNGGALFLKARFSLLEGNRQGAFGLAHAAVAAEPGLIQALFLLGQMYAADGDHFQAVQSYRKVLELNPFAAPARIELSRALLAQGASDSSREYADIAIKTAPRDHATRVALTRALLERGDLQKADTEIAQLLQQYPESPAVMSLMGSLSFAQKDFRTARQWLSRSFQRDPASLDTLTGLVALDLASRDPAGARQRVEAALRADENNVRLLLLAARTYRATGMPFASEKALSRAVDLDPSNFDAFSMLGQLYYDHGELSRGRTVFEGILRERPRAVAAHTMLAVILERQGLKDEAIGHYRAALDIDSEAAVAANNLAWLYVESARNVDEAIILARTAKKRLPEQAQVSDTLGWAYYRTERATVLQLALGYLQEAVDQDPGNPVYRYHLGAALARSGKTADARAQLEEALKLNADFQGAAETRRILAGLQ